MDEPIESNYAYVAKKTKQQKEEASLGSARLENLSAQTA
jgi:hypothetical protein